VRGCQAILSSDFIRCSPTNESLAQPCLLAAEHSVSPPGGTPPALASRIARLPHHLWTLHRALRSDNSLLYSSDEIRNVHWRNMQRMLGGMCSCDVNPVASLPFRRLLGLGILLLMATNSCMSCSLARP
jgi:hypothetical protein